MNKKPILDPRTVTYNKAVKAAYYKILRAAQNLLATIERHDLRCTIHLRDKTLLNRLEQHQLISPLLYLALYAEEDGERYCIQFGFEQFSNRNEFTLITAKFMRLVHKYTAKENAAVDIESCIYSPHLMNTCSELYEAIEDSKMNYPVAIIPYKPHAIKRKQMLAVA
ncbi:hypothetical protein [Mucilaginibacter sp.]|uniref:hypothetical protein n=1 Tax=Mucilaginibacter sp. TaxID=1882438 RepID=UPI0035BC945E